jgi:hypothetical protein
MKPKFSQMLDCACKVWEKRQGLYELNTGVKPKTNAMTNKPAIFAQNPLP